MISFTASFVPHVPQLCGSGLFFLKICSLLSVSLYQTMFTGPSDLESTASLQQEENSSLFVFRKRICQQVIDITPAQRNGLGPCEGPVNETAPDPHYSWTHTTLCYYRNPLTSDASYLLTYCVTSCSVHLFTPVGSSSLIWLNKVGH